MTTRSTLAVAALAAVLADAPAFAQQPAVSVVAIPPLTTPDTGSKGGQSLGIAWQATQMIATDLRSTSELMPLPPDQKDFYSYPEVTAPTFSKWRAAGAKTLVTGFVQSRPDGRLTFGCYVYDVDKGRELARKGFVVGGGDWRRAAHKCSGLAYTAVTGAPGVFDTRIAYIAESGSGDAKVKRIAIMDSDGFDHRYLTPGGNIVLTPRLSPKAAQVAFVTYASGQPQVRILDIASGAQRPLIANDAMTFAPRFSPDGSRIAFSMMLGTNSDIYVVGASGGYPQRLTTAPGIDTDPSFSPDGSKIVFESDRSGTPQLYVMNADGSNQRRLTFGAGWYASPDWSPDGQWIAFTRRDAGSRRIGVIGADGVGEKVLTSGPGDEGPNWAASSRDIVFQRTDAARRNLIYRVSIDGTEPRRLEIPQDGADPDWSGVMD
jgi:TolB protein